MVLRELHVFPEVVVEVDLLNVHVMCIQACRDFNCSASLHVLHAAGLRNCVMIHDAAEKCVPA